MHLVSYILKLASNGWVITGLFGYILVVGKEPELIGTMVWEGTCRGGKRDDGAMHANG